MFLLSAVTAFHATKVAPIQAFVEAIWAADVVSMVIVFHAAAFVEGSKLRKCLNTAQTSRRTSATIRLRAGSDPFCNPIIHIAVVSVIAFRGRNRSCSSSSRCRLHRTLIDFVAAGNGIGADGNNVATVSTITALLQPAQYIPFHTFKELPLLPFLVPYRLHLLGSR